MQPSSALCSLFAAGLPKTKIQSTASCGARHMKGTPQKVSKVVSCLTLTLTTVASHLNQTRPVGLVVVIRNFHHMHDLEVLSYLLRS